MRKNFVLDTNVLLHDPQSIFKFSDNQVIIPIYVLEEVDQFKKELSERGRNAREIARRLDQLRGNGSRLADGVPINDKGGGIIAMACGRRWSQAIDSGCEAGSASQRARPSGSSSTNQASEFCSSWKA